MSEKLVEFTDDNFDTEVLKSSEPVLVDFWAPWCGPCRMVAPTIEELSEQYAGRVKVGKLNTDGCVPTIDFEGAPRVGGITQFTIRANDVLAGQPGLLFYSKQGSNDAPFFGGTICIGNGILRTPGQFATGAGPCGGSFAFDFNAWIASGSDPLLVPGQKVWAQYWCRDPQSSGGSGLTDGVTFTICP